MLLFGFQQASETYAALNMFGLFLQKIVGADVKLGQKRGNPKDIL